MNKFYIEIKSNHIFIIAMMISVMSLGFSTSYAFWRKSVSGLNDATFYAVAVDPTHPSKTFAASNDTLYVSTNGGEDYRALYQLNSKDQPIHALYITPENTSLMYLATNAGLFESQNAGTHWQRIYHSSDAQARVCLSVMTSDDYLYIGTQKGLLARSSTDSDFKPVAYFRNNESVYHLKQDNDLLYVATAQEFFQLDQKLLSQKKLFSLGAHGQRSLVDELNDEELNQDNSIKDIVIAPEYFVLASTKGIYVADKKLQQWHRIPSGQVPLDKLTSLIDLTKRESCAEFSVECLSLLVGSLRGAYLFQQGVWKPIYKGMDTNRVHDLAVDESERVYAATERGVFLYRSFDLGDQSSAFSYQTLSGSGEDAEKQRGKDYAELNKVFELEPTIEDVHGYAIRYAEVHPEKIAGWRVLAKKKALYPQLDFDVDYGKDSSHSDSLWGTSSGGGTHYVGPDDKSGGKDFGVGVSLSWDFADYIWSTDQTTIDSRAKLMVELREDILDQITRLYFERRRIQVDLLDETLGAKTRFDQQLRLEELTALIDALTGGEFGRELRKREELKNESQSHNKVTKERGMKKWN